MSGRFGSEGVVHERHLPAKSRHCVDAEWHTEAS